MRADDAGSGIATGITRAAQGAGPGPSPEDYGVLVGWTHQDGPQGISLGMQSARSQVSWAAREIDRRNYPLTRNQALLLARYLLQATGQELDMPRKPHGWRAALTRLWGRGG